MSIRQPTNDTPHSEPNPNDDPDRDPDPSRAHKVKGVVPLSAIHSCCITESEKKDATAFFVYEVILAAGLRGLGAAGRGRVRIMVKARVRFKVRIRARGSADCHT